MPITTYSPQVRHQAYDLISQAFNRFTASQMPKPAAASGSTGDESGIQSSGGPADPSLQTSGNQPAPTAQGNPQPNFFNRQQPGPVWQAPDGFGGPQGGGGQGQPGGGTPLGQGGQGGMGNLAQLLALLGPLQSGQGFLPGIMGGQQGYQKPGMFPSLLQQQASQYGNPQQGPLAALFQQGSYSGSPAAGFGGFQGNMNQIGLNPQVRSEALAYILQQLAMGGMPQGAPQQPRAGS